VRARGLAAFHDGHRRALRRVPPDGASTVMLRATTPWTTARYSRFTVRAGELAHELGLCPAVLATTSRTARVLVEPVHDARA
jgi:hypothetical protein